ncbi:MAG: glycosyltransferase family 4 protein [Flavobacteriales bacterium]|nr:glycosyltransferase family 4 protein [Flavobacteriales bacterium]
MTRIGINARNILPKKMEGFGHYSYEITKRICESHPEHEFILFFDRAVDSSLKFPPNVKTVVLFPPTRHPFLWVLWFEFSLPLALKKHKIDVFWSPDGFCSLLTSVTQIITIHDINFEYYPKDVPRLVRMYFQYFFPKFARKAKHILTVSNYSKQDISKTYSISEQKISVVYNAPNHLYKPITTDKKLAIKKEFSFGSNYFLFVGSIHPRKNIQRLIEGFALAKKDLHDLKLVIVGSAMWKDKFLQIPKEIEKDIIFLGHLPLDKLTRVTASAFALTYIPYFEGFGIPLVEAMKCGVPILAANATCLPEIARNAAIYCDAFNINSIASGMIELFNNEKLRNELSQNGLKRSQEFDWDQSAEKIWEVIKTYEEK